MLNNTQLIDCDIIFSFTVETESKSLEAEVTVHRISNNKCDILALFPLI